jgi:hypothetical protein
MINQVTYRTLCPPTHLVANGFGEISKSVVKLILIFSVRQHCSIQLGSHLPQASLRGHGQTHDHLR